VRPGFCAIRVEVTVTGPESAEGYQELAAAVDVRHPVLDLFANPVPVTRILRPAY
jgi:putative redox protein